MMAKNKVNTQATNKDARGSYASVNGLNLYYEIHGTGEPLILLHGGVGAIQMFGEVLPSLAQNRRVVAVDFEGPGGTDAIGRPLGLWLHAGGVAGLVHH